MNPARRLFTLGLALLFLLALSISPAAAAALDGSSSVAANAALLDTASWALLAGFLTPLLTSVVQQPQWSRTVRTVVGVLASVVTGVITLLANGAFNDGPQTVLSILALVVVTSGASYRTLWGPVGVAPKIETATSPGPSTARPVDGR